MRRGCRQPPLECEKLARKTHLYTVCVILAIEDVWNAAPTYTRLRTGSSKIPSPMTQKSGAPDLPHSYMQILKRRLPCKCSPVPENTYRRRAAASPMRTDRLRYAEQCSEGFCAFLLSDEARPDGVNAHFCWSSLESSSVI